MPALTSPPGASVPEQRRAGAPVRRTQAERRAESDARIINAAAAMILERGIEGTSLAEIGRRAGYSHGLVHARFGSKDALVERVNAEAVALFTHATFGQVGETRGAEALRIVVETYLQLVLGPDPLARVHLLIWAETIALGTGKRPYRVGWDEVFRSALGAMIETGIADGSIRAGIEPGTASVVIVGMLRGVALQLVLDPDSGSSSSLTQVMLNHLDRTLRPVAAQHAPAT